MNLEYYLTLAYDFRNKRGVNCWGLYALVRHRECGDDVITYQADRCTNESIAARFTAEMSKGEHNHIEVSREDAKDFDLILLTTKDRGHDKYHCAILYKGKMLHAKGTGKIGSVWYDEISEYEEHNWKVRYYRYVNN